ncbi:MAG: hypothetical protein V1806_13370 [Pseudomonadota bacterium]
MKKLLLLCLVCAGLLGAAPLWAGEAPGPQVVLRGRLLTDLGYHGLSREQTTNKKEDVTSAFSNFSAASYLRTDFTSIDKTAGGRVELGLLSKQNNAESVILRYAYGWWRHGNLRLVAGQDDGWVGSLKNAPKQYLGMAEGNKMLLTNWGFLYSARAPQVRLEWMRQGLGAALGLVTPLAEASPAESSGLTTGSQAFTKGADIYANLPRADLAVQFNRGGLWISPGVGWAQYRLEGASSGGDDGITSWVGVLPVKYAYGPFTFKAQFHMGQNNDYEWNGQLINGLRSLPRSLAYIQKDGKIEDTHQVGGFLALEYRLTQALEITGGTGLARLSNDAWKHDAGYKNDQYTRRAYFVALPYSVTKNFAIHPEFSYYDYGERVSDGQDAGGEWLLGLQVRFVF